MSETSFNLTIWKHPGRKSQWGLSRSDWSMSMPMSVCLDYLWISMGGVQPTMSSISLAMKALTMSNDKWSALKAYIQVTSYRLKGLYLEICIHECNNHY